MWRNGGLGKESGFVESWGGENGEWGLVWEWENRESVHGGREIFRDFGCTFVAIYTYVRIIIVFG